MTHMYRYSFAYATMGQRLPTILGKAIEDVVLTLNQEYDEERVVDLVQCIERMDALMKELQAQAKLRPIIDDGEAEVALWNKLIAKYFQGEYASYVIESLESRLHVGNSRRESFPCPFGRARSAHRRSGSALCPLSLREEDD